MLHIASNQTLINENDGMYGPIMSPDTKKDIAFHKKSSLASHSK